jgi:uncharacterized protein
MRNIIGQVVTGADFFERPQIINKIRRAIRNGNQVYLSAPRRVGKTSIMTYLADNPANNEQFVYVITQSIDTVDGFYQEITRAVMESPAFGKMKQFSDGLKKVTKVLLQHINIKVSLPFVEVSTEKGQSLNFQVELERLLEEMNLENTKLIIMIDEFTETLDNILIKHGKQEARRFLQTFRELMHNQKLAGKVQFLLTGSIGLQPLVKKLEASDLINQLQFIDVPPLTEDEACQLFRRLTEFEEIRLDDETLRFLLQRIDWLMPFHVQLLVQEVIDVYEREGNPIDKTKTEKAFQQVFHQRNKIYFEQYYERLKKRLEPGAEYQFVHEILNKTAEEDIIEKAVVNDIAVKYAVENSYKATLETLIYDGYLYETADNRSYRFNSSILKTWWKKYVC